MAITLGSFPTAECTMGPTIASMGCCGLSATAQIISNLRHANQMLNMRSKGIAEDA